jgi:hypothetical protein
VHKQKNALYKPRFPQMIAKFAFLVFLFAKSMISSNYPNVVGFNLELARSDLFPFALANIVNSEIIEFSETCGPVVAELLPVMFK